MTDAVNHQEVSLGGDNLENVAPEIIAQLVTLCEQVGDFIGISMLDGTLVYQNRAGRDLLGLPATGGLEQFRIVDFLELHERDEFLKTITKRLLSAGSWEGESYLQSLSGRRFPVWQRVVLLVDDAGAPKYVASIGRDMTAVLQARAEVERGITAAQLARDERNHSESLLLSVVRDAPIAIYGCDESGAVLFWNATAEELFGYTARQVIGSRPPHFGTAEVEAQFNDGLRRVFTGETIRGLSGSRVRQDGTVVEVELAAAPLRNRTGEVVASISIMADVTSRNAATAALRSNEQLLNLLVTASSDAISIVEADGTLRYSSPVADRILGYPAGGSPLGINAFELVDHQDRDAMVAMFEGFRQNSGIQNPTELRLLKADGSPIWVEIVANNLLSDPDVCGIVLSTRDITDRKASQSALAMSEAALSESESRYRGIVEDQTELVCRYLPDTTLTFVNAAFASYYGRSASDLVGTKLLDVFEPHERPAELARLQSFGKDFVVTTLEDWEPRHDGAWRWYQWTDRAFLDDAGTVIEFQSVGHDIHERRLAERSLTLQAEILGMVAKGSPLDETLLRIAAIAESESTSWRCSVMLVNELGQLVTVGAPSMPLGFADRLGAVPIAEGSGTCGTAAARREVVMTEDVMVDASWLAFRELALAYGIRSVWSTPLLESATGVVLGTLAIYGRDVGSPTAEHIRFVESLCRVAEIAIERKRFEDRLAHDSVTDPLTGLPNRTLLIDRMNIALARAQRSRGEVAVLFLDLDGFKVVNDSLGHAAGDQLLVALAQRLAGVLRPGDTVARFGGDEFIVLCEDLPLGFGRSMAVEIAERLLDVFSKSFPLHGSDVFLRASIGIALSGSGDGRTEDLLRDADAAMYQAKELGKGRWIIFDETLRQRAVSEHETFNALHHALERGELRVHYQPLVTLRDGRWRGAEALVRWQHPERGLVGPADFIGLAEQSDLIIQIGEWVLSQAAEFVRSAPKDFVMSVNLSGRQLVLPDLVARVSAILDRAGIDPAQICLEITESVLMADADGAVSKIDGLKALGVKLAIDDFGTGYSSLAYLKRFRVDTVKIDRSFVAGLGSDAEDLAIVTAVISMAQALGLSVLAEGVENATQQRVLQQLGCTFAQGFLFSRAVPSPAGGFPAWVAMGVQAEGGSDSQTA